MFVVHCKAVGIFPFLSCLKRWIQETILFYRIMSSNVIVPFRKWTRAPCSQKKIRQETAGGKTLSFWWFSLVSRRYTATKINYVWKLTCCFGFRKKHLLFIVRKLSIKSVERCHSWVLVHTAEGLLDWRKDSGSFNGVTRRVNQGRGMFTALCLTDVV